MSTGSKRQLVEQQRQLDQLKDMYEMQGLELRNVREERDWLRAQLQGIGDGGIGQDSRRRKWTLADFPRFSGEDDLKQWTLAMEVKAEFFAFGEGELVDVALQCLTKRAQVWYHARSAKGDVRGQAGTSCASC
jgi:hypothetical protein